MDPATPLPRKAAESACVVTGRISCGALHVNPSLDTKTDRPWLQIGTEI